MPLTCVLPAAGASSRMRGGDKLLEIVDGKPCLAIMAERALSAGMEVIVTLPSAEHARAKAVKHLPLQTVIIPNARNGMSASLATAALALPAHSRGLMVLPPDMPGISRANIKNLGLQFALCEDRIVRASARSGTEGHPIIFPNDITREFWGLTGDKGAKSILQRYADRIKLVQFEDDSPLQDLDTPEAWATWRASRQC